MYTFKVEKSKVTISASFDAKEWEEGLQKTYEATKSKFKVVGFRNGHAPRRVIEQQYGENVFFDDTFENFARETLTNFMKENPKYEPVSYPSTALQAFSAEEGVKFDILFEIMPEFKLCKYTGLEFKKGKSEATEHEIEHEIGHLLEDNAEFNDVDRASKLGDTVVIDFVGSVDGVEFEGGKAENYSLELGSHSFIDTFEDQLVGKKAGEQVDVNVTFPKEYGATELAGKPALFKVNVRTVREKVLPTLDDKLISNATEFETVDAYKKHVAEHIQSMKEKQATTNLENDILDYIITNTEMEVPESLVNMELDENIAHLSDACKAYGMKLEDYFASMGTTLREYRTASHEKALKNVKGRYVLRQIIDENKIEVTPAEIEEKLKTVPYAKSNPERARAAVENDLLVDKIYSFLIKNNKIVEVDDDRNKVGCDHHHN